MEYTKKQEGDTLQVHLQGKFTFSDNVSFRQVTEMARQDGIKAMILDFKGVEYIDSAALGMLLLARDTLKECHCKLTLRHPHGIVGKMFHVSKFQELFHIVE